MILKLGKSYVAFLKVLFLPLIGGLIYFSTSSKVNAANAPSLPLPPCETVDGVEMGACPVNDSDAVSASISGTFSAGNSVQVITCLLYTSPSPRDRQKSRMPSSA